MVNEAAISAAIADLKTQADRNYAATARKFNIDRKTLQRRFEGETASSSAAHIEAQGLLDVAQEEALVERINTLSARGLPPTPKTVENLVYELTGQHVGGHWVSRFIKRHDKELTSIYLDSIDYSRRVADNSRHFEHYFRLLGEKITKYRIKHSNIYNMDEKGFNIGLQNIMKRVVAKDQLKTKKLLGASQDGSREFISLVAGICADGTALPPALIYEGKSGDLQNTWLEDYDHSRDEAYFAATAKGWTNEDLGVSWFMKVFQPKTAPKAGKGYRMLIVDGHSSHVNMQFIEKCDEFRIILAILPPHSTHRLQPLDLKIFSPLSTYYSQELDRVFQSSGGYSRVTKRNFWSIFKVAWQKAPSKANIMSAFRAAGIHPLNPDIVLSQLQIRPSTPPPVDDDPAPTTPSSVRAVRRQIKALRLATGGLVDDVALICRAAEKLVINNDILEHENKGLRRALQTEQKRRKRGKKMGLFPKDEPGQAMFFSPAKIAAIRQH